MCRTPNRPAPPEMRVGIRGSQVPAAFLLIAPAVSLPVLR